MTTESPVYPGTATWMASVHASEHDFEPLGAAVLFAADRVLTCAHVVVKEGTIRDSLWVAFPNADGCPRLMVASSEVVYEPPTRGTAVRDLAALVLSKPVPAGIEPAPLRCPVGGDLRGKRWWAFGFPNDAVGNSAHGQVGEALAHGWVRLDTVSSYPVEEGFSGAGLWSADYQAVVAVVGHAHVNGDGRAVTLQQADKCLPGQGLAERAKWLAEAAGELALGQWGWALAQDPEGARHWRPRARGVSVESERGWRFRGRTAAVTRIIDWLARLVPDRHVLVVTGSPGVGKSAVLGRIVTTADAGIRASLPADDTAVRAPVGLVSCAVHAKGKTALEVAQEIARAASAELPGEPEDLAPAIRDVLGSRARGRFNVIVDALDEATSLRDVRTIIDHVVLPLAETCADLGVNVAVGTRPRDDGGDLLARFGPALTTLDLDEPDYFAQGDLADYALACLQLTGDERDTNPYAEDDLARPFANRIAALSEGNFLVAGLVARAHGMHDQQQASPDSLTFPASVESALTRYLDRLRPVGGLPADEILTAVAFAESPGLPVQLWQAVIQAIYRKRVDIRELAEFARSAAANFLVESSIDQAAETGRAYRLFHQALDDALLRRRAEFVPQSDDERAITKAFHAVGRSVGWDHAPGYLLRALPGHAAAGGIVDDLLGDDGYLLHADLRKLTPVSSRTVAGLGRDRARLLKLTPQAILADPAERAAMFSVTEALEQVAGPYRDGPFAAPYTARWSSVPPRDETLTLEGHPGPVWSVCTVTVAGRDLLASGGDIGMGDDLGQMVRLWDPATGQPMPTLGNRAGTVYSVCRVSVAGRDLLASGGGANPWIWDPVTGQPIRSMQGHRGSVWSVCTVTVAGRDLLASGGDDKVLRIWDPATGQLLRELEGHHGTVYASCQVTVSGRNLLASGGDDGVIRLWDLTTGQPLQTLKCHGTVYALCQITIAGQNLLASGGDSWGVRTIWDPATGQRLRSLDGHHDGTDYALCPVTVAGQNLLASGGNDGVVRLWDPATGQPHQTLTCHDGPVYGLCPVTVSGKGLLASGGDDGAIRIWDPDTRQSARTVEGHPRRVSTICAVTVAGRELLASGGEKKVVRIWDPVTGQELRALRGHRGTVRALCPVTVAGKVLLASGDDSAVRIWDPATGQRLRALDGHHGTVYALCPVTVAGRELLASANEEGTIRLLDPVTGQRVRTIDSRQHEGGTLCPVTVAGRGLLAGGDDGVVRLWDPATGRPIPTREIGHIWLTSVCAVTVAGRELLANNNYETVLLWDPDTRQVMHSLRGHKGKVNALCKVTVGDQNLLASGGDDRTVRIWDPATGASLITIPVSYRVLAIAQVGALMAIGLDAGVLVIELGSGS